MMAPVPGNLAIVALDNARYGDTGMQETATASGCIRTIFGAIVLKLSAVCEFRVGG
jgi:hypothetical protein